MSHDMCAQRLQMVDTQDHWDLVENQNVQKTHEHKDFHCASKPGEKE